MKQVSREDLLNGWLKYHNTTVAEVVSKHPKEVLESADWFKLYPCTREEENKWVIWAKKYIKKATKYPDSMIERGWGLVYLDCAPYVKEE